MSKEIDININVGDNDAQGQEIHVDALGGLRHELDEPGSPAVRAHLARPKKEVSDPSLAPSQPPTQILASSAVPMGRASEIILPSEQAAVSGKSFNVTDDQLANITRKHEIDAYTKGALSVLTPEKTGLDNHEHLKLIEQAVRAVLDELLQGNNLLRIPPSEVFHVADTLRDHAFAYANHCANTGNPPCITTLKAAMHKHPVVKQFARIHLPQAGLPSDVHHHPRTGIASRTVISGHAQHEDSWVERHGRSVNHHQYHEEHDR